MAEGRVWIEALEVEAFGHFRDVRIELRPGLNVLEGPNEAGKSTLLALVRALLFGFERRGSVDRYDTERGELAARALLSTPRGVLEVRRHAGRSREQVVVRDGDGRELPKSVLREQLGAVEAPLYKKLYAFGLDDLADFQALAEQGQIREALIASSLPGAARFPMARRLLERSADELYTPRARAKALNKALSELDQARQRARALGDRLTHYGELVGRRAGFDEELKNLQARGRAARTERDALVMLQEAAPLLVELETIEEELEGLADVRGFPEDGARLLEPCVERSEEARSAVKSLERELGSTLERLAALERPTELELAEEPLTAAVRTFRGVERELEQLPVERKVVEAELRATEDEARALGLTPTALEALPAQAGTRARLRALEAELRSVGRRETELEGELRSAAAHEEQLARRLELEEAEVEAGGGVEPIQGRLEELAALERLSDEAATGQARLEELTRRRDTLFAISEPSPRLGYPRWVWLLGALSLCGLVGLASALTDPRITLLAAAGALILLAISGVFQRLSRARHLERLVAFANNEEARRTEVRRLEEALSCGSAALKVIDETRSALRERLGFGEEVDAVAIARTKGRLGAALSEAHAAERRLAQARSDLGAQVRRREDLQRTRELLGQESQTLREQVGASLRAVGLSEALEPADALAAFDRALEWAARMSSAIAHRRQLDEKERAHEPCIEELTRITGALGLGEGAPALLAARAEEALSQLPPRRVERARLQGKRDELMSALDQARAALEGAEARIQRLLEEAGVPDVDSFRILDPKARRLRELEGRRALRVAQLRTTSGDEHSVIAARLEEQGGLEAVGKAVGELETELRDITERTDAVRAERDELVARIGAVARDEEAEALRVECARAEREIERLTRCYLVERLAGALLDETRRRFEEDSQPKLLEAASSLFRLATGGRYLRVRAEGAEGLLAQDERGRSWSAPSLSRGTREQLFLAFRMAVLEDFAERRLALPVVLDDVLVNMDPGRARAALDAVAELAGSHQVIAFTCHPHLASLFEGVGAHRMSVPEPSQPPRPTLRAAPEARVSGGADRKAV